MGSATGGARGAMAPPKNGLGGPVMHLAPPIFWEKFCYETQLMYNVFL